MNTRETPGALFASLTALAGCGDGMMMNTEPPPATDTAKLRVLHLSHSPVTRVATRA